MSKSRSQNGTWAVAAAILLMREDRSMHYRSLTGRVLDSRLSDLSGRTPSQSLKTEMLRKPHFFKRKGRGVYAVSSSAECDKDVRTVLLQMLAKAKDRLFAESQKLWRAWPPREEQKAAARMATSRYNAIGRILKILERFGAG